MTELEKKLLLTQREYRCLLRCFSPLSSSISPPTASQINYYFDTDDGSMDQQNITCRIREKNGIYTGTMKKHLSTTEKSSETEIEIYDGLQHNEFTTMGLTLQGTLVTERHMIFKDQGCEVALDKNDYLGCVDYELEIEYTPERESLAQFLFCALLKILYPTSHREHLPSRNAPSKSKRFFARKHNVTPIDPHHTDLYPQDKTDPDYYIQEYFRDFLICDKKYVSCKRWNGKRCTAEDGICRHEPY